MIDMIYDFLVCALATFFFGVIFCAPAKSMLVSSIMGGMGYVIYDLCCEPVSMVMGYFLGTLFVSITAEIFARTMKMPAVIFTIPGVIPLVPGVGLYNTMRCFVYGDTLQGLEVGIETLSCAGVMAVAIALPPMMIKVYTRLKNQQ